MWNTLSLRNIWNHINFFIQTLLSRAYGIWKHTKDDVETLKVAQKWTLMSVNWKCHKPVWNPAKERSENERRQLESWLIEDELLFLIGSFHGIWLKARPWFRDKINSFNDAIWGNKMLFLVCTKSFRNKRSQNFGCSKILIKYFLWNGYVY